MNTPPIVAGFSLNVRFWPKADIHLLTGIRTTLSGWLRFTRAMKNSATMGGAFFQKEALYSSQTPVA